MGRGNGTTRCVNATIPAAIRKYLRARPMWQSIAPFAAVTTAIQPDESTDAEAPPRNPLAFKAPLATVVHSEAASQSTDPGALVCLRK